MNVVEITSDEQIPTEDIEREMANDGVQPKIQTKGGPLPQLSMPSDPEYDERNDPEHVLGMFSHADAMKRKAEYQLGQKMIAVTNEWFGPLTARPQKILNAKPKHQGVHDLSQAEIEAEKVAAANLSDEEKCRRDSNCLQPAAARLALTFSGCLLLIIIVLGWFICTCKQNKDSNRHKYEEITPGKIKKYEGDYDNTEMAQMRQFGRDIYSDDEEMVKRD